MWEVSERRFSIERCSTGFQAASTSDIPKSSDRHPFSDRIPVICREPLIDTEPVLYNVEWDRVVCDDSHRISNPKTDVAKSVMALASRNRWCVTGSPLKNSERDLASQLHFSGVSTLKSDGTYCNPLDPNDVAEYICSVDIDGVICRQGNILPEWGRDESSRMWPRRIDVFTGASGTGGGQNASNSSDVPCGSREDSCTTVSTANLHGQTVHQSSQRDLGGRVGRRGRRGRGKSSGIGGGKVVQDRLSGHLRNLQQRRPISNARDSRDRRYAPTSPSGLLRTARAKDARFTGDTSSGMEISNAYPGLSLPASALVAESSAKVREGSETEGEENDPSVHLIPRLKHNLISVQMNSNQKALYSMLVCEMKSKRHSKGLLAFISKLRQCALVPCMVTSWIREIIPTFEEDFPSLCKWISDEEGTSGIYCPKLDRLSSVIRSVPNDDKVVVFSEFHDAIHYAHRRIVETEGYCCRILDGSQTLEQRSTNTDDFKNDPSVKVLLCTYKVGSEGHHLISGNHVVLLDMYHQLGQAVSRCFRQGQTKDVHLYPLVTADSIESYMHRVCFNKLKSIRRWCCVKEESSLFKDLVDNYLLEDHATLSQSPDLTR